MPREMRRAEVTRQVPLRRPTKILMSVCVTQESLCCGWTCVCNCVQHLICFKGPPRPILGVPACTSAPLYKSCTKAVSGGVGLSMDPCWEACLYLCPSYYCSKTVLQPSICRHVPMLSMCY